MNKHRLLAMAVATCAAGLSATACTAGITSAGASSSPSPGASSHAATPAASSPAPAASHPTPAPAASHPTPAAPVPVDTVNVGAPIGGFPVPHGAQLESNFSCGKQIILELGSVTPAQASAFYTSALPRAGYKITLSTLSSDPNTGAPQGIAELTFTGHGYTGVIIAVANLNADASAHPSSVPLPSTIAKNNVEISLTPPGPSSAPGCPMPAVP